jgi:hypothetical protein
MSTTPKPKWVSVAQWVTIGGDAERRVRQQIADGELRTVREGKRVMIDLAHAEARKRKLPSAARAKSPRPPRSRTDPRQGELDV